MAKIKVADVVAGINGLQKLLGAAVPVYETLKPLLKRAAPKLGLTDADLNRIDSHIAGYDKMLEENKARIEKKPGQPQPPTEGDAD